MKKLRIYEVSSDGENFRNLISESGWQFESIFMYGTEIDELPTPTLRYRTLEEDIADEQELFEIDDDGDPKKAELRYSNGVGDCAYALGFGTGLVLSRNAIDNLATALETTGQILPVQVNGDDFFIYNCTRVIDAVDPKLSEIRYVSNGRPSQFTKLVFQNDVVQQETLFKTKWPILQGSPSSVDYSKIPPPLKIFGTQHFVDLVSECELKGFRFKPVDVH